MRFAVVVLAIGCNSPVAAESKPAPPSPETAPTAPTPEPVVSAVPDPPKPAERLLAQYTTKFKADPKLDGRVENITIVAAKFADRTLAPGEELSFNQVVGPRTEEAGFKNAPTIFMGETFEGIGGGTCQVSSTLYAAVLHAGVTITDRRPHSRPSNYIDPGLDATVSFPAECAVDKPDPLVCYDLKFKNPFDFPLIIRSEVGTESDKDGKRPLTISIFGTGEVPKVTTRWAAWNTPDFEKRHRRVSYWKNDRKRLKQPGRPGLEGARYITLVYADGHTDKREVISRYKPVPEVWEVGMEWKNPESE